MTVTECCRRIHRGTWPCARAAACAVASVAALLIAVPSASAQCQYEVTAIIDIGNCDIGGSSTFGQAMNNNAEVVGFYRICAIGNDRAFFWSQQTGFITLPHPPGVVRSWANDINDHGQIVGQHEFTGIGRKGFVYDMKTNEYQHLEPLHDGVSAVNVSSANAINNNGVVAGSRSISKTGGAPFNAVIWRPFEKGSPVEDLGIVDGPNSAARDVNEAGVVAGWDGSSIPTTVAYVWNNDEVFDLGIVPGTDSSHANAVTDELMVVGAGLNFTKLFARAFLWQGERMVVIPPVPPFTSSTALSANNSGQVGLSLSQSGVFRAYLWQHGELHSINDLLLEDSEIVLQTAGSINNKGQIRGSIGTSNVLLTPVDVPLADLNYDCKVDSHDLKILLGAWGPQPMTRGAAGAQSHPADFNGDGVVDVIDLFILLGNWSP